MTIVFLVRAHLVPSFVFHPIRKSCIINRVKSKCLTSIGTGGSPLKGRKTKERTRERTWSSASGRTEWGGAGERESCEFYVNPIAGWNRLHRSAKSICAYDASVNGQDIVSAVLHYLFRDVFCYCKRLSDGQVTIEYIFYFCIILQEQQRSKVYCNWNKTELKSYWIYSLHAVI